MDKKTLMARIAAILSTLLETNGSPESMLYIFCDMNMQAYETIRNILVQGKLVTIKSNYVTLTNTGIETANKINAVIAR